MSAWQWPDEWVIPPKSMPATDGIIMAAVFSSDQRFKLVRTSMFRRCVASGRYIWPFQKAWVGIIILRYARIAMEDPGAYTIAWLSEDQYIIQKLKGNI